MEKEHKGTVAKLFEEVPNYDFNQQEPSLAKPIFCAMRYGPVEVCKMLAERGASFEDVAVLIPKGENALKISLASVDLLTACCYEGNFEMADFLLKNFSDKIMVNARHTEQNRTNLFVVVSKSGTINDHEKRQNYIDLAKALIAQGADPLVSSQIRADHVFPMEKAVMGDDVDMVVALHKIRPDLIYHKNPTSGNTPMELAYYLGKWPITSRVLEMDNVELQSLKHPKDVTVEEMEKEFAEFEADKDSFSKKRRGVSNSVSKEYDEVAAQARSDEAEADGAKKRKQVKSATAFNLFDGLGATATQARQ